MGLEAPFRRVGTFPEELNEVRFVKAIESSEDPYKAVVIAVIPVVDGGV